MKTLRVVSKDASDTHRLGVHLGQSAIEAMTIGLIGPLGAGKTAFARGVAEGLGIGDSRAVTSPTFVLCHEYQARLPIIHVDVYRLADPRSMLELGLEEWWDEGVCLVEWADRVLDYLPRPRLDVSFGVTSSETRQIEVALIPDVVPSPRAESLSIVLDELHRLLNPPAPKGKGEELAE